MYQNLTISFVSQNKIKPAIQQRSIIRQKWIIRSLQKRILTFNIYELFLIFIANYRSIS